MKHTNQKEKRRASRIRAENFPILTESINLHLKEAHKTQSRINTKRSKPRYIIVKMLKAKDRENIESNKNKVVHCIQGDLNKINS